MQFPHACSIEEVSKTLGTNAAVGLTYEEAEERAKQFGLNQLDEAPPVPIWKRLVSQFTDIVIWILIAGAVISALLGEWIDAIAIGAIILLNGLISFFQEMRAEESLAALRKLSTPHAKVFRDGSIRSLPSRELVPGDIIELDAGDHVPADARLTLTYGMTVQEAALTGESLPVQKSAEAMLSETTGVGDRQNMAHMATIVAAGKGRAIVTSTGMSTELGKIAGLLKQHRPEPTPLQRRLSELGRILIVVCLSIVAVIFVLQLLRGGNLGEAFLIGVSLSVAAVPEGLPAVVTISLALGLQRMVKRNALVRNLPSVETLGTVTVICSDKTGTLTKNEMTVEQIRTSDTPYQVTGIGYWPEGKFVPATSDTFPLDSTASSASLDLLLKIAAWCNNAQAVPPKDEQSDWSILGDPTEGALIIAAMKRGVPLRSNSDRITLEIPFDSTRKMMSIAFALKEQGTVLYTKGAPESVLERCRFIFDRGIVNELDAATRHRMLQANSEMAHQALRVLAVAYRDKVGHLDPESLEEELVFVGLVGMIDPPREEAKHAVEKCISAGIRPVMITGDHLETASAI
ncbi:HAD-IC family P-type ATPase, partial [bacterium]|nr:HAD-IC family P-type ATPase [bacterium]